MNFPDGLLTSGWLALSHAFFWPLLLVTLWRAPWARLQHNEAFHVLLGATVGVMVLWTMKAGFADGLNIHLLGATLLTLMFGWPFAVLSLTVALLGFTLANGDGWTSFAMNGLLLAVLPVLVSFVLLRTVERFLPSHFFVYIFVCAFFGGAIAIGVVGLVSTGVLNLTDTYTMDYLVYNYLRYYPLVLFPEAFVTGMLTTVFVVYRPQWVSTFDDDRYLKGK